MIEITIKVSNEEKRMTKKHLHYDTEIELSRNDPLLKAFVNEAVEEFADDPDDVKVIITMVW